MTSRRLVVSLAAAGVAVLVNLPLLNALLVSFKDDSTLDRPLALPSAPTTEHYANVLYKAGYDFPLFFLNSVLLATGAAALVLVIAMPATYAIVRLGFGGGWLLGGVAALRLLPAIFFAVPFYLLFGQLGLLDTVLGLIMANTFLNLPLGMVLIAAGLRELPVEVEEAAAVDGASVWRILGSVVLPLLAPTLGAAAVLTFLFSWDDYLFAVVLATTDAQPVTMGAANFVTSAGIRWGDISAATVLSALPPILCAVFAQRYLVRGLAAGAVNK